MLTPGAVPGREPELRTLTATLVEARTRGAALLVAGEPGIGKSSLLGATRDTARAEGDLVLWGAGVQNEAHLPYAALHALLGPLLPELPALARAHHEALATAFGLATNARPDLFLVAEAAFALLTHARARGPLLVVADDVHWMDPPSHQILTFVAHRRLRGRIGVIGSVRPGHTGPFPDGGFPRMDVGALDDEAATELLRRRHPGLDPAGVARVRRVAGGNPLALLELPRATSEWHEVDGAPTNLTARLQEAFVGRVAVLPAGTRDALLVAALGSSSRMTETVAALTAFGTPGAAAALFEPARVAGLVTEDRHEVTFRHPLVRSGVVARESLARRHAAHAAYATVLGGDPYRQAWHRAWSITGPDDAVAAALVQSADDAVRRGAVTAAVSGLERAALLTTSSSCRGGRLVRAAGLAFGAGRPDAVERLLAEARRADLSGLDEVRAAQLTEALNDDVRADSRLVRSLCEAASRAHDLGDDALALDVLLGAALRCWWADSGGDSVEVVAVLDRMGNLRDDPRHLAAVAIAEPVERGQVVLAALAAADLGDVHDGDVLRVYALAAYAVGDLVLATDLLDRAERAFRAEGRLGMLPVVLALQVHIRLDLGDWTGSVTAGREVVTVSRETGQDVYADNHALVEARGLALRGDWRAALTLMAPAERDALRSGIDDRVCLAHQARGAALMSAGLPAQAFQTLRRQYDSEDPGHHLRESFAGLALTVEAAVACGRTDEARRIVDRLDAVAVMTPSPLLAVNLLYAHAVLAEPADREHRCRRALAADLSRWPWMRARVELVCGSRLRETGRREEAGLLLHSAASGFSRIGAVYWARAAESALALVAAGTVAP